MRRGRGLAARRKKKIVIGNISLELFITEAFASYRNRFRPFEWATLMPKGNAKNVRILVSTSTIGPPFFFVRPVCCYDVIYSS